MDKKNIKQEYHVFEVGDTTDSQLGIIHVILKVLPKHYEFMYLTEHSIDIIGKGYTTFKKGEIGQQPFSIFDKYNYLLDFKKIK